MAAGRTSLAAELREVAVAELAGHGGLGVPVLVRLAGAQLDAADLARDRLRQLGELEPADALVGREVLARVPQDLQRGVAVGLPAGGEHYVGLRDGEPQRVRAR